MDLENNCAIFFILVDYLPVLYFPWTCTLRCLFITMKCVMHSVLFLFCANKENDTVSRALFYKNVTEYLRVFFYWMWLL